MSTVTAIFAGKGLVGDRAAWAARVRLMEGSQLLQLVNVLVDHRALWAIDDSEPPPGLMSALARAAEDVILQAVSDGNVPTSTPGLAYVIVAQPQWLWDWRENRLAPAEFGEILWSVEV